MRTPKTKDEWQEAVDAAHVLLILDSARQYGLVSGGPKPNASRCEQILQEGKKRGIRPREDAVDRAFRAQ